MQKAITVLFVLFFFEGILVFLRLYDYPGAISALNEFINFEDYDKANKWNKHLEDEKK